MLGALAVAGAALLAGGRILTPSAPPLADRGAPLALDAD